MKKNKKKNKRNKKIITIYIISFVILAISLVIILPKTFSNKQPEIKEELNYVIGRLYTPNASANMLDYIYNNDNVLLSPLNADISLAILYNGTDNTSYKEIKKYFNSEPSTLNDELLTKIKDLKEAKKVTNAKYEKYIKEFYEKEYENLKVKSINKLSQKDKDSLILLLIKINLYYNQESNKLKDKDIEKYKLSDKERKYNGYTIKSMIDEITTTYESYTLENKVINYNELYYDSNKKYTLNKNYKNVLEEVYNTKITKIDYNSKDSKTIINNNISDNTLNNINRVIDHEDIIDQDLIMISSLLFNYSWSTIFNSESVVDEEFTSFNNKYSMVEMMYSEENTYLENNQAIGFLKPFENDKYAFVGILPKNKEEFSLGTLNLDSLLSSKKEAKVYVGIPKFTIQSTNDLKEIYKKYNITEIFSKKANLHQITNNDVMVSKLLQKESISIGEYGTTKAMSKTANLSARTYDDANREIILNRPFAFLIINKETNDVLLIGKVVNPE